MCYVPQIFLNLENTDSNDKILRGYSVDSECPFFVNKYGIIGFMSQNTEGCQI